jgi:hypothetical protein
LRSGSVEREPTKTEFDVELFVAARTRKYRKFSPQVYEAKLYLFVFVAFVYNYVVRIKSNDQKRKERKRKRRRPIESKAITET